MRFRRTWLLAALIGISPPAAADLPQGLYSWLGLGPNLLGDIDIDALGSTFDAETDVGFALNSGLGYQWANGLRLELDGGFRYNSIDNVAGINVDSDVIQSTFMVNGAYAIDTASPWTPYAGAGAGVLHFDTGDRSDTGFALQGFGGMEYRLRDRLGLFVEARYVQGFNLKDGDPALVQVDSNFRNFSALVGIRLGFPGMSAPSSGEAASAPPVPPQPPAPLPVPPETRSGVETLPPPPPVPPAPAPSQRSVEPPATPPQTAPVAAVDGPPLDPGKPVQCDIGDRVRRVVAGFCYQAGGRILPG